MGFLVQDALPNALRFYRKGQASNSSKVGEGTVEALKNLLT